MATRGRPPRGRGNRSMPATPLKPSSLRNITPVADTVERSDGESPGERDRRSEAEKWSDLEQNARLRPERKMKTRSQATTPPPPAPPPPPPAANPGGRRGRQTTPDEDQLQQELRQASEEAEDPVRRTLDAPPSSVAEYSSVSWVTERLEFERQEAEREKEALQEQESQQAQNSQPSRPSDRVKQQHDDQEDGHPTDRPSSRISPPTTAHHRSRTAGQSARRVEPASSPPTSRSANVNPVVNVPVLEPTGQQRTNAPPRKERREQAAPPAARRRQHPSAPVQETRLNPVPITIALLLAIIGGALFMFGGNIKGVASKMPIPFSFPGCGGACGAAPFPSDAFNRVLSTVDQKLADMAKDVASFKEDIHNRVSDISIPANPLMPPRVNFLSDRLGAEIDMHMTSPIAVAEQPGFVERVVRRLAGTPPEGMAPLTVLRPWDELGECWCAPGPSSQLVVMLGYPIVPDEVVVEHIAKGATLSPFLAPRHMELWAEYVPVTNDDLDLTAPDAAFHYPGAGKPTIPASSPSASEPSSSAKEPVQPSGHATLPLLPRREHEYLLSTLGMTYPNEPESAFSNHPQLGPSFFRLGKWEYDLDSEQNIQRFKLDAVINLPGFRVQRVAVRTAANWGGPFTCLYRVRLHGKY